MNVTTPLAATSFRSGDLYAGGIGSPDGQRVQHGSGQVAHHGVRGELRLSGQDQALMMW
jgi:hypothetical protein